jgi:hypothetical protein
MPSLAFKESVNKDVSNNLKDLLRESYMTAIETEADG